MKEGRGLEGIIPELRDRAGLSEAEAREKLGLPEDLYSRYERGDREMPVELLGRMAGCFGVEAEAVLRGRGIRFRIRYREDGFIVDREETEEGAPAESPGPEKTAGAESPAPREFPVPERSAGAKAPDRKEPRKPNPLDFEGPSRQILDWQRTYSTGLAFFDGPHRDFIDTANSLYTASLIGGWESAR
ncbi:MAG: helix-turn-helix domain-containing protein, partial [Treponema sp.]|nr:helix-turn-helix domain-containing protein [Treponema sp.]